MERMLIVSNDWEAPLGYIMAATDEIRRDCSTAYIEDSNESIEQEFKKLWKDNLTDGIYLWEGEVCDVTDSNRMVWETTLFRLATVDEIRSFFPSLPL